MEQQLKSLLDEMEARAKEFEGLTGYDVIKEYCKGKQSEAEFVAEKIRGILENNK